MQYTYLLVNFFTILIPFLFSFHPKLQFHKTWKAFFPAVFLTGLIFILWDMYFTHLGVWGFNDRYLTGIEIGNLPLEEVLFFFCIPYACVFTFHSLCLFLSKRTNYRKQKNFTVFLVTVLLVVGIMNIRYLYTSTTFISLAILLLLSHFVWKLRWLNRFYMVYGVLLIPFFIVNGILTGTGLEEEVVWYNSTEFLNIRLNTIPIEDIFYGMELILANLLIYKFLLSRKKVARPAINNELHEKVMR
ncbi:lycopene cyclase domain-containing protein [Salinimicrobium catena]|uniref:lycopene cyclase domain-containing protein n=1 Tax=Salinimicrobium catena TaxID=390640 RepID=UPI002FE48FCC